MLVAFPTTEAIMSENRNESITLYFKDQRSDKAYSCQLIEVGNDACRVDFQFGRRGSSLTPGCKTPEPVPYAKAKKLYDALVREKTAKGYVATEGGTTFTDPSLGGRASGITLQLSNAAEGDASAYLNDLGWAAQQKHDGERRGVRFGDGAAPIGINKKGLTVALPTIVAAALAALPIGEGLTVLDAELVGDTLHVFDVLIWNGTDYRSATFTQRAQRLGVLPADGPVRRVATAFSAAEKVALFDSIKSAGGEGVVFKRVSSSYQPGRPNRGGDHVKWKFVAEATVRVARVNEGKRSIVMELRDDAGAWNEFGSVTVPGSQPIPAVGSYLEVSYLYATTTALFQPVLKGVRVDQDDDDCTLAQLKMKPSIDDVAAVQPSFA